MKIVCNRFQFFLIFFICFYFIHTYGQSENTLLVQVGNKKITVQDFQDRTGFTVRPKNLKPKDVALNNLILEKLLAIEAVKNKADILSNPVFQARLKGIKEQLMRQNLYYKTAYNKVYVDTLEILNGFRKSVREYDVQIYIIKSDSVRLHIEDVLQNFPELTSDIFSRLEEKSGGKPLQKVKYFDPNDDAVQTALYTTLLDTNAVVGPVKTSTGDYILIRVINWTDYPLLAGPARQQRWNEVKDKIHREKASRLWNQYQANLMEGRRIEFESEPFNLLSDMAYENYIHNQGIDSIDLNLTEIPVPEPDLDLNAPFFKIDNKVWSVRDFREAILSHPLVYRTKYLIKENFKYNFKMAVVDMVRDYYLSQEAYNRGVDTLEDVKSGEEMWHDAFLSAAEQSRVINSAIDKGIISNSDNQGKLKYWESYLTDLRQRYLGSIKINFEEYNKIKVKDIHFMAIQPGAPFPAIVPGFPIISSSANLEYTK